MQVELSRYTCLGVTLAACVTLSGCKAKENGATMDSTASTMGTTTGAMATSADTTAGATAPLSDANIAALVDEANVGDSTLAAAALPNLTSSDAKNFAKLMMGEHHALHVQGLQAEKAQNLTPQMPTPDPFMPAVKAEQDALASMSKGTAYDSTYIANEVAIHSAVLDWAGKQAPQNAGYQQYLKTAGPVYQKHLDRARAILKKS
jgi:putative membrane protein